MPTVTELRIHGESAAVEHRAHAAVATGVGRIVARVREQVSRGGPERALRAYALRAAQLPRSPDPYLAGSLADSLLAGDIMGRWHSLREALRDAEEFAAPTVVAATPSDWRPHNLVQRGVTYLYDKQSMSPQKYASLRDGYRAAGFTIAGQTEMDVLEVARRSVARSLRVGYDADRAGRALNDALRRAGYEPLAPWHAKLVAQMNYASAYGAGSWEMLHDPKLAGIIPAYRYVTMHDNRVRPSHAKMEGFVARRDHPIWDVWWPPNGYNCRCRVMGVSANSYSGRSKPWPKLDGDTVQPDETGTGSSFAGSPRAYIAAKAARGRR